MQGFERAGRQLLDAAALAGYLVPAGSMFAFLAGHRAQVFPDAEYADLFSPPGVGRPSLPATQMAAVLTLQALHDYSDRETAEAVKFDVRWKAAIGVPLDDPGFDPSSLVYWRRRLAKSERPHRVNEAVKTVIEQTGILMGRRRLAVDSAILADAVATQDTVTQLVSAIRKVAREVPGAAEKIAAVCTGHDYSAPGKPKIDWEDPAAQLPSLPFGDRLERDEQFQVPLVVLAAEPGKRMRGSFGASRAVPLASRPRERMPYAVTLMPSSRTTGRICASMPRLISEYSICSAAIGWTACARRIVSAPISDRPM